MTDENKTDKDLLDHSKEPLKSWIMSILTLIFVGLYIAAIFGMIEPLPIDSVITRLEPIIFVIIGYYFGRLPAQATENTLKTEIARQNQKTDAAQQIKERVQQEREVLEEKIKNAKSALNYQTSKFSKIRNITDVQTISANSSQAIETAVKILNS